MTNKALNTAIATNKTYTWSLRKWSDFPIAWSSTIGTWNNPINLMNKVLNTATMTNRALS